MKHFQYNQACFYRAVLVYSEIRKEATVTAYKKDYFLKFFVVEE